MSREPRRICLTLAKHVGGHGECGVIFLISFDFLNRLLMRCIKALENTMKHHLLSEVFAETFDNFLPFNEFSKRIGRHLK